jgi:hypothetical protein
MEHLPQSCMCAVCLRPMVDAVSIEPCHDNLCRVCVEQILWSSTPNCPLCRRRIIRGRKDCSFSNVVTELMEMLKATLVARYRLTASLSDDALSALIFDMIKDNDFSEVTFLDRISQQEPSPSPHPATAAVEPLHVAHGSQNTVDDDWIVVDNSEWDVIGDYE